MNLRFFTIVVVILLAVGGLGCDSRESGCVPAAASHPARAPVLAPTSAPASQPTEGYAGPDSCAECHEEAYEGWRDSHHAHALRDLSPESDDEAFTPARVIHHGTQTSSAKLVDNQHVLTTVGRDGQIHDYQPTGVIGVYPLWQYMIPTGKGRLQVTELAFDPDKKEWFDVYTDEDRQYWEWGHWSGRGMNWNSMCATCHTTNFQKNYDPASDGYRSTYQAMGVDCEQCHGPMQAHVDWQNAHEDEEGDPTIAWLDNDQYMAVCGSCHARRGALTERFKPGEKFLDHYDPVMPDHSDVFYPDGQIRDEDFEYVPFMLSYMQMAGVRCYTCHDSHSGKRRKEGNELCLQCHERKMGTRIAIDALEHGFHPLDKEGSLCTDCHMPQTVYMARHWRHNHGMTIPDPLLTKEYGIPNACTRCHAEEGIDWEIEWMDKWYGQRMERPTRRRGRLLARIKSGDNNAMVELLGLLCEEDKPNWRAVYVRFLAAAIGGDGDENTIEQISNALIERLDDPSPLVQASAIEALEPIVPAMIDRFMPKLQSPSRVVRVKAAWVLRRVVDPTSPAHGDLMAYLQYNQDQPTGAFQRAMYEADTGQPQQSLAWFDKAVTWDPGSPAVRYNYAIVLSQLSRLKDALIQMSKASDLDGDESFYPYSLGLLYGEMGRMPEARDALRAAVARDPNRGRFWYNLGLAEDRLGNSEAGLEAMRKAEDLEPDQPAYPYARAMIHLKLGRKDDARAALKQVLRIDPTHKQAHALMNSF